jgi:epoxide hydrolase
VQTFTVQVADEVLADLRDRLRSTRWPQTLTSVGWSRGVPTDYLRPLVEHWSERYDWRGVEARLNAVPQAVTEIDGQRIHFLHARSADPDALPLLLTHGWPGSVLEYLDLVEQLTTGPDAFHLVVPSVPGAGFSTPLSGPGWDHGRIARAFSTLMGSLGYERYGAAGGDTGSVVSPLVAAVAPDRVVGVHVHGGLDLPRLAPTVVLSAAERERLRWGSGRAATDRGYAELQSTRPHTVAYALTDSPVGQLAWIVDKVHDWTDPAVQLPDRAIGRDHLLDLATLAWVTGTGATSAHLYYENRVAAAPSARSEVPFGRALFPTDPAIRAVDARDHRLVHWTQHDHGGHFAALEAPDLLVEDLRTFFRGLR